MVGWFVCLLSVVWSDSGLVVGGWLAGWFVCYPVCRLVKPSVRLAIQPITDWPANHPSIYLIANQPTKDCSFIRACIRSVLEFPVSGVRRLPVLVRLVGCGGATWPMPTSLWPSLGSISSSLSRGIPSSISYPRIDLGTLNTGCMTCFAMPCIIVSVHIYSHVAYSSQCSPYPLLVMAEIDIWWHPPLVQTWNGILGKALFEDSNPESVLQFAI